MSPHLARRTGQVADTFALACGRLLIACLVAVERPVKAIRRPRR